MCGSEGARVRHIYYENVRMENFWGKKKFSKMVPSE